MLSIAYQIATLRANQCRIGVPFRVGLYVESHGGHDIRHADAMRPRQETPGHSWPEQQSQNWHHGIIRFRCWCVQVLAPAPVLRLLALLYQQHF